MVNSECGGSGAVELGGLGKLLRANALEATALDATPSTMIIAIGVTMCCGNCTVESLWL